MLTISSQRVLGIAAAVETMLLQTPVEAAEESPIGRRVGKSHNFYPPSQVIGHGYGIFVFCLDGVWVSWWFSGF